MGVLGSSVAMQGSSLFLRRLLGHLQSLCGSQDMLCGQAVWAFMGEMDVVYRDLSCLFSVSGAATCDCVPSTRSSKLFANHECVLFDGFRMRV